jgi:DNA-binding CsgD family transcriptional regulator
VDTTDPIQHLSDRERDILALIAKGRTNAEIGDALGLRFDTVKWYVSEILSKLAVDSREQAAETWRAWKSRRATVSRRVRALLGGLSMLKASVGLVAAATTAGAIVVAVGVLASDVLEGSEESGPRAQSEPEPAASDILHCFVSLSTTVHHSAGAASAGGYFVNKDGMFRYCSNAVLDPASVFNDVP